MRLTRAPLAMMIGLIVTGVAAALTITPTTAPTKRPRKPPSWMDHRGTLPVPEKFTTALAAERPEYVLGENVLVHFAVQNTGEKPFSIAHGGDYRGAPRHTRFVVTATPVEGGEAAPDPYPVVHHMGGLGGDRELKPAERFEQSLPLMHYVHIPAAGEYVIRVSHDLGWLPTPAGPAAAAETRLRFVMPDEKQAAQVVRAAEALPPREAVFNQRTPVYADLSVMRYAVYLPLLEERLHFAAGTQDRATQALAAMQRMPDPAALKALLRIAEGKSGPAVERLASAISHHLPASPTNQPYEPPERFPADFSWREEFAPEVLKLAFALIEMERDENIAWGGRLLAQVGRTQDLPAVIAAMDRVIPTLAAARMNDGIFSTERNTMASLQMSVNDLHARGAAPPADPKTPGEIVAYLVVANGPKTKAVTAGLMAGTQPAFPVASPELIERVSAWCAHPTPYVRELSLNASPLPLPDEVRRRLPALIEDGDVNVRMAASRLAQQAKEASCADAIVRRLKIATTTWEVDQLANTAPAVGAELDAWHVMADRLGEEKLTFNLLRALCGVAGHSGGFGWRSDVPRDEIHRVQARWQAFLRQHDAVLRAGKRFRPGDGVFTEDLLPPEFHLNTPQGDWPPRKQG